MHIDITTFHNEVYVYISDGTTIKEAARSDGKWFRLFLKTYCILVYNRNLILIKAFLLLLQQKRIKLMEMTVSTRTPLSSFYLVCPTDACKHDLKFEFIEQTRKCPYCKNDVTIPTSVKTLLYNRVKPQEELIPA